jgi:sugar/nucleoside kinase (ribokinase family)
VSEQSSFPTPLRQELRQEPRQVAEQQALQAELDRSREEILRLRDLLIGMEHELGAARGRLAMHEDSKSRIASAQAQLSAKIPGAGFLFGLLLRLLRGRV